jgi:putative SOS response-associated peptidase YedK
MMRILHHQSGNFFNLNRLPSCKRGLWNDFEPTQGPLFAADAVPVSVDNFVRAESNFYLGGAIKDFGFGKHTSCRPRDGKREVVIARWGLIQFWMKEKPGIPHINARAETVLRRWQAALSLPP